MSLERGRESPVRRDVEGSRRQAMLALLLIVPAPSIGAAMLFWWWPDSAIGQVGYAIGKAWLYGLPAVWWLLVERRRASLSPPRRGGLDTGFGTGVAIVAAIVAAYFLWGRFRIEPGWVQEVVAENGLDAPLAYVAAAASYSLVNSLLEEYVFRWFIYRKLERLMPASLAVVGSALVFTAHHVIVLRSYFTWDVALVGSFGIFVGGVLWSMLYRRYESVCPGWVSHVLADVAVFAVGWMIVFG